MIKVNGSAEKTLKEGLFEIVPFNVAVIDNEYRIVAANGHFEEYFGDWEGRRCFEVYKGISTPCPECPARGTFLDERVRVSDETGVDRHGRTCHYVVHHAPITDDAGEVTHVIEMSTDVTETRRWRREYDLLFERASCFISVIDRDFRIVRANEKLRDTFGEVRGSFCYEAYKRRKSPCKDCPAVETFKDGLEHESTRVGVAKDGSPTHYIVTTSPLSRGKDGVAHVIEIATDITETHRLEVELRQAHDMYASIIRNSTDGIVALDENNEISIMNPAAKELLQWKAKQNPKLSSVQQHLPFELFSESIESDDLSTFHETRITNRAQEEVPVCFRSVDLKSGHKHLGRVAYMNDLREVKRLENEKLDAERLAAVGQTVAGLAHTIKNLLMGLEGGMYMVDSGLKKGKEDRITQGWEILQRNFGKTTTLVKDFLAFAKGKVPHVETMNPVELCQSIVELYRDTAKRQGVDLQLGDRKPPASASLDSQGIEACLTNLISNAIDAATLRGDNNGLVEIRTFDLNDDLVFEVTDNGTGMDEEIKRQVFTTFFTTKGGKGTGLGLLTTRKIVQEHGGEIELDTIPGEGSLFRIRLPRKRLESLEKAQLDNGKEEVR
ncbi:PAS domain-containing protein [bacterium]|nr:PAS domain-containing protein [bacterium]